ncbi:MAG: oligosaccharide flippase family protein [Chitinispirillaceae bacterium]|nr:oligosaccharide flippase family protein [Chitinispirillaceae bacterium]
MDTTGSRLIRNSLFSLFNSLFTMATSWVISIWIARQLGPTNYGIFSLVLWISGTITGIIGMGLIHAVTKFIAEYQGKNEGTGYTPVISFVLRIEVAVTVFATVVLIFFKMPVADYFFSPKESFFIFIAALGLLPGIITAVFSAAVEGIQKFEYFTWSNLIITPCSFTAKIIVLLTGQGVTGLLYVMLIFSLVNMLFYFFVLRREGFFKPGESKKLDGDMRHRIQQYNKSQIAIHLCDKIIWDKSENFFLGRLCKSEEVGFYNLGFNIAQRFISFLPTTLWRVLFPAMSSFYGSGNRKKMRRLFFLSTRYLAFFTFPVGVAGMILAYQLIHFLYGHQFIAAQRSLQIIFISSIVASLSNPASAVLYGFDKQSFIYRYGALLAVINITLDILLIKRYGATGAAICYGITTVLGSTGGLLYTCRTMHLRYPIVSLCKIAFATIIMGIVMEIIILQNGELPGFILSIVAGGVVYLMGSLVLGTFEKEDFHLLQSIKPVCPNFLKVWIDDFCRFVSLFKPGR